MPGALRADTLATCFMGSDALDGWGHMKRREFIVFVGGAIAWPLVGRARQSGKIPRIGYFSIGSLSA